MTTAAQLAGLAKLVNEGNSFTGKTIKLGADIDLNGRAAGDTEWTFQNADKTAEDYKQADVKANTNQLWKPIGGAYDSSIQFSATIDGQDHTMSKMAVVGDTTGLGFIGAPYGGNGFTIKNLTFDDCMVLAKAEGEDLSYLLEITTNVYGNGYSIDADALTVKVNSRFSSFNTKFNGSIDLVRYSQEGKMNATVKAQDNVVFLVKKDDISINNVELKGCSDQSILNETRDSVDLTKLDNVGTVLEIVGDNCSVSYSRINNGRTVVRVYGKGYKDVTTHYAADHRISANVNNSILGYGREFILKTGTNYSKKTTYYKHDDINYLNTGNYYPTAYKHLYDEASPYLTKANGDNYLPNENNLNDEYFYNNYVLVDLTVENCVFENAGLFSVGMESTFGGLCLHGYDYSANYHFGLPVTKGGIGWGGIAGTSYPAVLRLKGDVRFYDWKLLSSVNSDTLITGPQDLLDVIGLNMNVSNLIDTFSQQSGNENIVSVYEQDKQKYVNGAIAVYGGGKNYGIVDCNGVNKTDIDSKNKAFETLKEYSVPVSCFIKDRTVLIYYTAGAEDFRFHLYDATSAFDVAKQLSDIADGSAYSWLMK